MADPNSYRVTVTDIDVPFTRLVAFFVKAALAAIPAAVIVAIILRILGALVASLLVGSGFTPFLR
jgi:hypothetical protein